MRRPCPAFSPTTACTTILCRGTMVESGVVFTALRTCSLTSAAIRFASSSVYFVSNTFSFSMIRSTSLLTSSLTLLG